MPSCSKKRTRSARSSSRSRKRSKKASRRRSRRRSKNVFSYGITVDVDYIQNPAMRPLKPHPDASKFYFERYEEDIEKWKDWLDEHPNVKPIEPPDRRIRWLGNWFHDGGDSEFSNKVPKNIIRTTQWYYGDKKYQSRMAKNFEKYYSDLKKDGRVKRYRIRITNHKDEE